MLGLRHIAKIYNSSEEEKRVLNDVSIRFGEREFLSTLSVTGSDNSILLVI